VEVSSSTVTAERQSRKLGVIGVSADGTNRSACRRSIETDARVNENAT
jgi:hypothetical protein